MSDPELEPGPRSWGSDPEKPFQVVVRPVSSALPLPGSIPTADEQRAAEEEEAFSLEEIEAAYLRALETADLIDDVTQEALSQVEEAASDFGEVTGDHDFIEVDPVPEIPSAASAEAPVPPPEEAAATKPEEKRSGVDFLTHDDSDEQPIVAEQVLEALLFVGGEPLPTKKLLEVLGGSTTPEQLDEMLSQLNARYQSEGRPYTIRLQTGGYVMQLREEFEAVRGRTFGHGPKEVKLAQDALEVLALVAYRQPASREELEEMGKPNLGPILRQLLRRQLVCLERDGGEEIARYRTTPRFLGLFGLQSLDNLPQAGDFNFK